MSEDACVDNIDESAIRTCVRRVFTFDAAHQLPWHQGKCARLHGHTYTLEVEVCGTLDHNGVLIDFADLKALVTRRVLDDYDHSFLNEVVDNPTAERLAQDVASRLGPHVHGLREVRLWETPSCSATVTFL